MNPSTSLMLRRSIALAYVCWALLAIVLSLGTLREPPDRLDHPFIDSRVAGRPILVKVAPSAASAGALRGDLIASVNGRPYPLTII